MTAIVAVSDTHIPDFAKRLPAALVPALRDADLILHAGDVTTDAVLEELTDYAPVRVAMGNNDRPEVARWGAEPEVLLRVDGVQIAMVHDAGRRDGRERRLRRRFPEAGLIVFGHSHIPIDAEHDGVRLLNPGSATWKRRQPSATYAVVTIEDGSVATRILELP